MQRNFARIYHGSMNTCRNEYSLSCTCGYSGNYKKTFDKNRKIIKKCPNCGTTHIHFTEDWLYSDWKNKKKFNYTFYLVEGKIENKKLHIIKRNIVTSCIFDENAGYGNLKIDKEEIYELIFDSENPKELKILNNNKELKITKRLISIVLSHLTFDWDKIIKNELEDTNIMQLMCQAKNTIFDAYHKMSNETVLSNIVFQLYCNPFYEILYNTYGNLEIFKHAEIKNLKEGCTPSAILSLPKTICNKVIEIAQKEPKIFKYLVLIQGYVNKYKNKLDDINLVIQTAVNIDIDYIDKIFELYELNFNMNRVYHYLTEDIYTYQGIDSPQNGLSLLCDYINMCRLMEVTYEKYPRSLKLRHDMAKKNYNLQITEIETKKMKLILQHEDYKSLAFDDNKSKYIVILPTCANDIILEGQALHHCVGSYVNYVMNKKTKILFMRLRENPNKPLITLEVKNDILRQYAGFGDRIPNEEEMEFIKKYCNEKKVSINDIHAERDMD